MLRHAGISRRRPGRCLVRLQARDPDELPEPRGRGLRQHGRDAVAVRIGHENPHEGLRSTSVVSTGYGVGSEVLAGLGVLGPTRMLVVDDVHHIDEASRDLLLRLSAAGANKRQVLVVTHRETDEPFVTDEALPTLSFCLLPATTTAMPDCRAQARFVSRRTQESSLARGYDCQAWRLGRVVRHRSAKPGTPVRLR